MRTCIPNYGFVICKLACLYKICNSVDTASTTANKFYTTVSVVSEMISHYTGLYIVGFALPCIFQSPIFLPMDQRLSHGVAYLYMSRIHFLFSWPWPCLSICPPSSPQTFQWKHFPLLYHTHELPSNIYTGLLEVRMGILSKKYWCIHENLNLSYTPPPLKKFQKIPLMDPNKIHLIGEYFVIHGARVSRRVLDNPTS